ncbi:MAG: exodeoxyribonuclease V subunit beta [Planctomycetes bacterium]|nr:exodeoxyribonuclease V subunit beta [Planctomycetota bacterium]
MKLAPFDLPRAELDPGVVLLEASAGTGKTYTLVGILLRLLLEQRIERLDQALVVTFTIAATEELKNRLRAALHKALRATTEAESDPFYRELARLPGAAPRLRQALEDFDRVGIATIHGFCKRVLEEAAFESHEPFQLDFTADPLPLLYRAAADSLRSLYEDAPSLRSALLYAKQVTPEQLVGWYRLWQRYPHVPMQPAEPQPEPHLAALQQAVEAAALLYDEQVIASLERCQWKKNEALFPDGAAVAMRQFGERLRRQPALVLDLLCELSRDQLGGRVLVKSVHNLAHPFFQACNPIANAASTAFEHLRAELLLRMAQRTGAHKRSEHVLSFDDLLVRTHEALRDPRRGPSLLASLQARYQVGLIDEFQDTDTLQYEIFAGCFRGRTLFLIGDPKQSIYGFRGANLRTYLLARGGATRCHTLDTNYRSSGPMVDSVMATFARPDPFAEPGIEMPAVHAAAGPGKLGLGDPGPGDPIGSPGAALCWRYLAADPSQPDDGTLQPRDLAEERILADVTAEISRLLRTASADGRALQPHDFAVLTRTNKQAVAMQTSLRAAGIASAIGKAGDIFQTEELQELERFLYAVLHPTDLAAVRAAMATRLWGRSATELAALARTDDEFDTDLERLDRWRRTWLRSGFVAMIEQVLVDLRVHKRFLAWQGGERRLTNLRQLFELLHDAEHQGRLSPEGAFEWLQRQRAHQDELDYTLRELRLESDGDAVQILTVHGSKGLEYEIVFCPFLWDGKGPRGAEVIGTDDGGHELAFAMDAKSREMQRAKAERLAEELRLCYVALTRSKRRCYVHIGPIGSHQGGSWRSALAWLLSPSPVPSGVDERGQPCADWVENWAKRCKASECQRWYTELQRRVAASDGAMSLTLVPLEPSSERAAPPPPLRLERARHAQRRITPRGLHSFSSLVSAASSAGGALDQVLDPAPDLADPALPTTVAAAPRGIFAFARGAAAGQCLHDVLEHCDLGRLEPDATTALVRSTLAAHGLVDAGAHPGELDPVPTVVRMLHDVAAARLPGGPRLGELCGGTRAAEWQFLLPAEQAAVGTLARLFTTLGSAAAQAQAPRLLAMSGPALRGFLVGFVDLIAEHDGRYWVLDWKSNHLGDAPSDYGPAALAAAMQEHDYVLQYHLYVLALHRHLRLRLRDYDPARHLGGACYVFLRGAEPDTDRGLCCDRVPVPLVLAMDAWIGGESR